MWSSISTGEHPLTSEGVVMWPGKGLPMKSKLLEENDVHITGVFPGEGKYQGTHAGGFEYANEPGGAPVGKVGTGFSDEMRQAMWQNQQDYVGRVAKIRSQQQYPTGAYRAPAFMALHEDYPTAKMSSILVKPYVDATLEDLEDLGIVKTADNTDEVEVKDASLYLDALKTTPINYQEGRGVLQNILDHIKRVKVRGDTRVTQRQNAENWNFGLADPMQQAHRLVQYRQGLDPVTPNKVDQFLAGRSRWPASTQI